MLHLLRVKPIGKYIFIGVISMWFFFNMMLVIMAYHYPIYEPFNNVSISKCIHGNQEKSHHQSGTDKNSLLMSFEPLKIVKEATDINQQESFGLGLARLKGLLQLEEAIARNQIPIYKKPEKVKKIFVIATWRSGSTFLGDLINKSPGVFYTYEPVHFLQYHLPKPKTKPMELIRSVFDCSFSTEYLKHFTKKSKRGADFIQKNSRVFDACKSADEAHCIQPDFMQEICNLFPVRMIKEVRLSLTEVLADKLANNNSTEDWKIIYLVRDPRAIAHSRAKITWCQADPKCKDIPKLCGSIYNDLDLLNSLKARQPDRYYLLKYEDLSLNPDVETRKLFAFLGLDKSSSVRVFLESHTKKTVRLNDPHSTYRNSNLTVSRWRGNLPEKQVNIIENACSSLMKKMNYVLSSEMDSKVN